MRKAAISCRGISLPPWLGRSADHRQTLGGINLSGNRPLALLYVLLNLYVDHMSRALIEILLFATH